VSSQLVECLAYELVQILLESRIGGTSSELPVQLRTREPACAAFMGHDVHG
jgi:hypothetical protein